MSDHAPVTPAPDAPTLPAGVPDPALGEYAPGQTVALTDAERWPTLTHAGSERLAAVRGHPSAPQWVHECGDRLRPADHARLAALAGELDAGVSRSRGADPGEPAWLEPFLDRVQAVVPRYRAVARLDGHRRRGLADFAPVAREDLARSLAEFVPVDVPLDRVLEGSSSGSTGAAVVVPLHPVSTAGEVVMLRHLAAQVGVVWEADPDRLALANVVDQRAAFTYVSALTALTAVTDPAGAAGGEPTMARINLHAAAWRDVADRAGFLEAMNPQVLSSSPLPLLTLADLGLDLSPLVVFSGAAHLTPVARERARATWGAPVIDVYGSREAGLLAADLDGGRVPSEHVVLPRRVHVEILDGAGDPVPDGARGEVTVTVDDNPYLPLVRYRTGDTAALRRDRRPDGSWVTVLLGLEGRSPVRFRTAAGTWVPSVDATQVLQAYGVAAWHLHQAADEAVRLVALVGAGEAGKAAARDAADAVSRLLGRPVPVIPVERPGALGAGAKRRFSTDLGSGAGT